MPVEHGQVSSAPRLVVQQIRPLLKAANAVCRIDCGESSDPESAPGNKAPACIADCNSRPITDSEFVFMFVMLIEFLLIGFSALERAVAMLLPTRRFH
jgi:hypothetical protein